MGQDATDEALMCRVAAGDGAAFQALVERHLPRGYAIARRTLDTEADAEDALQEAFTKVWVNAPAWQPGRAAFGTWLYRVLVNTCLDAARRKRPESDSDAAIAALPDGAPSAEAQLSARRDAAGVRAAVGLLPPSQRMAVVLCYFEELSNPEAARIMDVHVKALEGLLVRARRTLRQILALDHGGSSVDA